MSRESMLAAAEQAIRENRNIVQGDARGPTVTVGAEQLITVLRAMEWLGWTEPMREPPK